MSWSMGHGGMGISILPPSAPGATTNTAMHSDEL